MAAGGERDGGGRAARSFGPVIRQLMDPRFLHEQLRMIQAAGAAHPDGNEVGDHHYGAALAELARARAASGGAPFVAHASALVALLQSTLTACFGASGAELADPPAAMAGLAHRVLTGAHALGRLCPCDPRWIECELAAALARLEDRPPFPAVPAPAVPLADDARVIVVGDWGSGLPGAVAVAGRMAAELGRGRPRQQHVIHLGDVYYSGRRQEYETRFLPHWPVAPGDDEVHSWALNGNHDMFSGGHGYFGGLLRDPRFRGHGLAGDGGTGGVSSWFSLENDHWQILGLDSAYADGDLAGGQADWVVERLGVGGRRTMLLSHHQPFSAYEPVAPDLVARLRPAIDEQPLDAWFWGHEHRCAVYAGRPVPYLGFGSCVGHGGVPRPLPDPSPRSEPRVTWASAAGDVRRGGRWGRFGFAVLDFAGPAVAVRYIDETGVLERVERI